DWQLTKTSLNSRVAHTFNSPLMSDVAFVVEDPAKQDVVSIPAHKYILGVSSPVFFAMFYGQMSTSISKVELPDCDSVGLIEFLRYLYCNRVKFTMESAIQALYLSKKYLVPSLAKHCVTYIRDNVTPQIVFDVLPYALKLAEKDILDRCFELVDFHAVTLLGSQSFLTVTEDVLVALLQRDSLRVTEVDLFRAVQRWLAHNVEQECSVTGELNFLHTDKHVQRLMALIRFPLMKQSEFINQVVPSGFLSPDDVTQIMLGYVTPQKACNFSSQPRSGPIKRCARFQSTERWFLYSGKRAETVAFTVSASVRLHGVRLYGDEHACYRVNLELFFTMSPEHKHTKNGCYNSELIQTDSYHGYDVKFDTPVMLKAEIEYQLSALIVGPPSCYG
ncbi:predicted protein, partial [Nematostella vectensis]